MQTEEAIISNSDHKEQRLAAVASSPSLTGHLAQRLIGRGAARSIIESGRSALVWVSGPAGSGKTCLALEYIEATGRPAVWIQLDRADADPIEFFRRFGWCIAAAGVAAGWEAPQLPAEQGSVTNDLAPTFIRTLSARLQHRVCIILDNVHECEDQPFFPRLLASMAAGFAPDVTVLLLSRRGPPSACARLQVHGEMWVVPPQLLMLSTSETEGLLQQLGVPDAATAADAVFRATGGWPAGVAMAAVVLRHRGGCDLEARIPLEPTAQDYFEHEVYSWLNEPEREALLTVCWLTQIPAGCWVDAQLELPLGRLLSSGALMRRFENGSVALNPLLQRFLREQARRMLPPLDLQQRIDRCIDMLLAEGSCEEALELSRSHDRLAYAAQLIAQRTPALLQQSSHQTVARWIQALPEMARTGELNLWLGASLKLSAPRQARDALAVALAQFQASSDCASRYLALGTLVETYFADSSGSEPLQTLLSRHAVDYQSDFEGLADIRQRSQLIFGVGITMTFAEPGHPQWGLWEQRARDAIRASGDVESRARLVSMLSHHYFLSGRHKRLQTLVEAFEIGSPEGQLSACAQALKGLVLLYASQVTSPESVEQIYIQFRQWSDKTGIWIMDGLCTSVYGSALIVKGRTDEAMRLLGDLAARTPVGHSLQHAHVSLGRAWAANWTGNHAAAAVHARDGLAAASVVGNVSLMLLARVAEAIALAFIDPGKCRERVEALQSAAREHDYPHLAVHRDLLLAWLELRAPDVRQDFVVECLSRGLRLLEDVGTGMLLHGVPQILGPLCDFALRYGAERSCAERVIQRFRLAPPPQASRHWPWPIRIRCLGTFQLEVSGQAYDPGRKSKHRQLDLLKILAAHSPQAQSTQVVAGWLWPEADKVCAMRNFNTTLSRLRGLVGHQAVLVEQGTMRLNPSLVFVDVADLRRVLNDLDEVLAYSTAGGSTVEAAAWGILDRYPAHLLAGESSVLYSRLRDTLRSRVASVLARAAACLQPSSAPSSLVHLLERSLETDPSSDSIALALIRALMTQSQHGAALKAYRRYQMATQLLGVKPLRELQQLASTLYSDVP